MAMNRAEKEAEIKELNERFSSDELVVLTHYSGLTVAQMTQFRRELVKNGASYKVTKNSLAKIALKGRQHERESATEANHTDAQRLACVSAHRSSSSSGDLDRETHTMMLLVRSPSVSTMSR